MAAIQSAVGIGAPNRKDDVVAVQALLKHATGFAGPLNGDCDAATTDAILDFQKSFLPHPDGVVDPDGVTWRSLVAAATLAGVSPEWSGDSSQWTQAKKLLSLEPVLRLKVPLILAALRAKGFQPRIVFGWRSVAVQEQLFREGKTTVHFSFHNAQKPDGTPNAYAADIIDSRWAWTPPLCNCKVTNCPPMNCSCSTATA